MRWISTAVLIVLLASRAFTGDAPAVRNLPNTFYQRPGLEAMPHIDYEALRVVNVKDLGATGDGVQEVNAIFGKALDLVADGGGIVFVPKGIYRFRPLTSSGASNVAITRKKMQNVHLVGEGEESVLLGQPDRDFCVLAATKQVAATLLAFGGNTDISIRNLSISQIPYSDMRRPFNGISPVVFWGNRNVQLINVHVDQGEIGICFWGGNRGVWVVDCDVRNTSADLIKFDDNQDVVAAYNHTENGNDDHYSGLFMAGKNSRNNRFLHNTMLGGSGGRGWGRGVVISGENHEVSDNWIEGMPSVGIYLHEMGWDKTTFPDQASQGHKVTGNTVVRCDLDDFEGNKMVGHKYGGALLIKHRLQDTVVRGNRVWGSARDGILLGYSWKETFLDRIELRENAVEGCVGCGIAFNLVTPKEYANQISLIGNTSFHNLKCDLSFSGQVQNLTSENNRVSQAPAIQKTAQAYDFLDGEHGVKGVSVQADTAGYVDMYATARTAKDETDWVAAPALPTGGISIDVKALGAKGDGTTDDLPAFVAAIGKLGPEGGIIRIPIGTYLLVPGAATSAFPHTALKHHLAIASARNVQFVGDGPGSKLIFDSAAQEGLRLIGVENASVRNLSLALKSRPYQRGNRALLDLSGCENVCVENVNVVDSGGPGIRVDSSRAVRIERCTVSNAGTYGIAIVAGRQISVTESVITQSRDGGIFNAAVGSIVRVPQFIALRNNTINAVTEGHGIAVISGNKVIVAGNRIADTYQAGIAYVEGAGLGCAGSPRG